MHEGQLFYVNLANSEGHQAKGIKLTAKPKALDKPFGKTIIMPFLKWWNAKHEEDSAHHNLTLDDLEEIVLERTNTVNVSA